MAFKLYSGKVKTILFEGDTAREVRDGSLVTITDSATVAPLRNDSLDVPLGVARRNDTTIDSALVPVDVPIEDFVLWRVQTDSDGGLVDSDVGQNVAVDTAGGNNVLAGDSSGMRIDRDDVTFPTVRIIRRLSATEALVTIVKKASTLIPDTGSIT